MERTPLPLTPEQEKAQRESLGEQLAIKRHDRWLVAEQYMGQFATGALVGGPTGGVLGFAAERFKEVVEGNHSTANLKLAAVMGGIGLVGGGAARLWQRWRQGSAAAEAKRAYQKRQAEEVTSQSPPSG